MHRAGDLWRIYTNIVSACILAITLGATIWQGQRYRKARIQEKSRLAREHVLGHTEETASTMH